jgi:hypothetical protein
MEKVYYDTLVSNEMLRPCFSASHIIGLIICICNFNIGFLALAIEVFAQKVKNSVDTFLRVMLPISFKLLSVVSKYLLKHGWSNNRLITVPHLI